MDPKSDGRASLNRESFFRFGYSQWKASNGFVLRSSEFWNKKNLAKLRVAICEIWFMPTGRLSVWTIWGLFSFEVCWKLKQTLFDRWKCPSDDAGRGVKVLRREICWLFLTTRTGSWASRFASRFVSEFASSSSLCGRLGGCPTICFDIEHWTNENLQFGFDEFESFGCMSYTVWASTKLLGVHSEHMVLGFI